MILNCSLLKMQPEEHVQSVKHFGALVLCISSTGTVYSFSILRREIAVNFF
jgi:hypothetical protein